MILCYIILYYTYTVLYYTTLYYFILKAASGGRVSTKGYAAQFARREATAMIIILTI